MHINDHFDLGVINITPNSFSDTERLIDEKNLINRLKYFRSFKNIVWDVGFESTAPMNQAITLVEEKERFFYFQKVLKQNQIKVPNIISIDSYKVENYPFFYQQLKKANKNLKIIFNDVSGIVDNQLFDFLKSHPDAYYIYCFTEVKSRDEVLFHMQNLKQNRQIVNDLIKQFEKVFTLFKKHGLSDRLFLDPSFGFSKLLNENWELIESRAEWLATLDSLGINNRILIGLSKKSFLHKLIDSKNPKEDSEFIHYEIISWFRQTHPQRFFFRVHDPAILGNI